MSRTSRVPFRCLVFASGALEHPGPAAAATRAGATAILDAVFCGDDDTATLERNLGALTDAVSSSAPVGLRLRVDQVEPLAHLLDALSRRPHEVVLSGGDLEDLASAVARLRSAPLRRVLIDVTDVDRVVALDAWNVRVDGLVASGHEAGGWVGENTSFLLLQKLIAATHLPVYVRGGAGVHFAASCKAASAAGVVLDDQLLLMPESPLPQEWRQRLETLSGREAVALGERLGAPCRVYGRPDAPAARTLKDLEDALEASDDPTPEVEQRWRREAAALVRWGDPAACVWPLGQGVAMAAHYRDTYGNTASLVERLLWEADNHVRLAARHAPLAEGAPLARSHGTRFPIVQGPMTRVSDRADFAHAVASGGALPFLALALLRGPAVRTLLEETRGKLGEQPWGVGILGFVPEELREEQLAEVLQARPPFALIAGGRPDQARRLEDAGIPTYLHVPVPALLSGFLQDGSRRFVFEGRECGGHVGPLCSSVLWERMIDVLLTEVADEDAKDVHVLFAGGVHDAVSAAMVAVMAAPLAARGMKVGVLMGTAYLFTHEAVATGAIVEGYQSQALECRRTVNLVSGVGHANRCARTPFADEFYAMRKRLLKEGRSADEIREALDGLLLGRLRIASKGARREGSDLVPVDTMSQLEEGMYMIGDVATTHHRVESIEALHTSVSVDSEALVEARAEALEEAPAQRRSTDIAIVGIATLLPEAQDPQHFWANLLAKKVAVKEVPESRWDWRLYYDPDTKAPDKSHSRWGGFFDDVVFDPVKFGIPPNSMRSIGPGQLLSLEMVRRALADADYADRPFDRENTAVIMANGDLGGLLGNLYVTRTMLPLIMGEAPKDVTDRLPEWTEEAFTGSLTNIAAGRVANRFDFGGANYTVDAACASSLTAVDLAAKELETHRCNVAIVGGVDVGQTPYGFVAFSKTQALSPSGATRTFDKDADGIVISEGLVFVVLKRLEDAERDGDKVYAVIKSVGTSSDGKALGMTAPRPLGQMRAVHRAYERAGFPLRSIGFYEAHGTGTPVGDRAELETIDTSLRTDGAEPHTVALGSVKTLIGHTKTAAGLVGLVKGALALRHQVLPAHAGVENPLQPLLEPECPLYLLDQAKPWFSSGQDPRRVGVSAFGFGGTNTHVVLEEYDGQRRAQATGAADWPCELIWLRGETSSALRAAADALLQSLTAGAEPRLADLGYACARNAKSGAHSAAIVAESVEHLRTSLATLLEYLDGGSTGRLPAHIQVGSDTTRVAGQVAFLFPGQGSQYVNMAREAALYCDEFRDGVEHSEAVLAGRHGRPLSDYVYPPAAFTDEERARQEEALKDTHVAQPAIGAVSCSYLALARRLGLRPDMVAGHSYGEFTALYAAGSLSYDDLLALSEARGRAIAQYNGEPGGMGAIQAPRADVEKRLRDLRVKDVVIANHNAPRQTIVSGAKDSVARVLEAFEADGTMAVALPVSAAFHSPLMAPARAALAEAIAAATLRAPSFPVYSNVTAAPYDGDIARMRRQLEDHLTRPVEFLSEIERMYADGARVFVEMGPNSVLRDLSDRILGDREHLSVSMDPKNTGLRGLLHALGRLLVSGVALDLPALFAGRAERSLDLNRLVEQTGKPPIPPTAWIVTGTNIRPVSQETSFPGKAEYFTSETAPTWRPTTTPGGLTTTPGNGGLTTTPGNGGLTTSAEAYADHAPTTAEVVTTPQQTPPHQTLEEAPMNTDPLVAAYESYQETMRVFLRTQEEVMRSFLAATEGVPVAARPAAELPRPSLPAPTPPPPAPAPKPVPVSVHTNGKPAAPVAVPEPAPKPAPDATPALTHDTILSRLVTLLSEKTGYPAEFLGVDLDLEAELGIDSIKRIEMLASLRQALPTELATSLRGRMDNLTRIKTLRKLVDVIMETIGTSAQPAAPGGLEDLGTQAAPHAAPQRQGPHDPAAPCPRYVMQSTPLDLPGGPTTLPDGVVLITPDPSGPSGVAPLLATALASRGARTHVLDAAALTCDERLTTAVADARRQHGRVGAVVHLSALEKSPMPTTLDAWKSLTQRDAKSLYRLVQLCLDDWAADTSPMVLAASLLDGTFGRRQGPSQGLPVGGGVQGFLKTVHLEHEHVRPRAVDFDGTLSPEAMAETLAAEILTPGPHFEIGYPQGRRVVFTASAETLATRPTPSVEPSPDWVMLVTGGASGITCETTRRMLRPGMKLLIVGRTPEPTAEPAELASLTTADQLRARLVDRARGTGRPPAQIEAELRSILHARVVRDNLASLRAAGAQVEYAALDVRNEQSFGTWLDDVYARHGRIDGVIHGAGVIEDRLVVDKTRDSLDRVFDTKVDSAFILYRHLRPESLRMLVFFASTAGRFGNRGQGDYAMANEVLNRLASRMATEWSSTRIIAVNWGPWATTGMASDAVNKAFVERGITPIPTDEGCALLLSELRNGASSTVEVVAGEGPWHKQIAEESVREPATR